MWIPRSQFTRSSANAKYEDTEGLILNALSIPIKQPLSYAAFDKNELVGIHLNRLHKKDEFSKLFEGKLYDLNAKLCIKKDYAEGKQGSDKNAV
uniref:Uncharacterized protein n=1 Tax=Panagrolaimus superbus TaxID=310955 RepID=A0A914Y3Y7_9BILA